MLTNSANSLDSETLKLLPILAERIAVSAVMIETSTVSHRMTTTTEIHAEEIIIQREEDTPQIVAAHAPLTDTIQREAAPLTDTLQREEADTPMTLMMTNAEDPRKRELSMTASQLTRPSGT